MSASSEAEGRTPTPETCVRCGRALILEHERYRGCHYDCREVATLATRSPRDEPDSVGALISSLEDHIAREDMPNIRRTLTALKYAHQKDLRRAAPSVEARDADDLLNRFHSVCDGLREYAESGYPKNAQARYDAVRAELRALLPPEKT